MKRKIIQSKSFSKDIDYLIKKRSLLENDFIEFKNELVKNPQAGDFIIGTSGCRKIRLKSSSKGKSGGFRICYYDMEKQNKLYLLFIFAKNEKENLTTKEKQILKELIIQLKKEVKNE